MKCTNCGAEIAENNDFCEACKAPVGSGAAEIASETAETNSEIADAVENAETVEPAADTSDEGDNPPAVSPEKKKGKMTAAIIAVIAVIAIAAFAIIKMTAKDPKEVVITAFENIWPKDQVSPVEELFGVSEFSNTMITADTEGSLSLKLDNSNDEDVNAFAGIGLRLSGKNDITNKKSSFNMGLIYNDMDLANLNAYYGDETIMIAVPELVGRVFTLDLSDGLADRLKDSPTIGAYLAQSGVDADALAAYFQELMKEAENQAADGTTPFDLEALMNRYREGCKAQDNFKAALAVKKADKGTFTMNGKEVSCTGYSVTVSKDSLIEFLRTSSDFFLQDETLKNDFMKQLETTVRMSEIMGGSAYGQTMQTPAELQQQTYEEAKESVDEMITYLNNSLTDVQMTVYVDKAGNLASVEGKTAIKVNDESGQTSAETDTADSNVDVSFQWNLQGGTYLTQNMYGTVTLSSPEDASDAITVSFNRKGSYDKTNLTDDLSVEATNASDNESFNFMYTSSYSAADGSYHTAVDLGASGEQLFGISGSGVVDQMEKGKSFHLTIDELDVSIADELKVILSGEYELKPLESEITALEGEQMDMLAASESDWQGVFMEGLFSALGVLGKLGIQ